MISLKQPRFPIAVMLLSHGNCSTYHAIDSALKFGLPVYVGLTEGQLSVGRFENVRLCFIHWDNDFSAALRRLQKNIDSDFILRLDSDEVLISFPQLDWSRVREDIFGVRLQETELLSPGVMLRLYRNKPGIQWSGRVHERLMVEGKTAPDHWRLLPSVVIRHLGYDDPLVFSAKMDRNLSISQAESEKGEPGYQKILTVARTKAYKGQFDPLAWLKCFKHPTAQDLGLQYDRRFEAAEMLCSCGYTEPARFLLDRNPLILRLHLSILAAEWRAWKRIDEDRLHFLCECLSSGFHDPCYGFPKVLLGADRETTVAYVRELAKEWSGLEEEAPDVAAKACRQPAPDGSASFRRSSAGGARNRTDSHPVAPQHPTAVCILSHGNQAETERAVRSARGFGLPIHVGLTAGNLDLEQIESVRVHRIPWQEDFAAARNQLLKRVQADFVLWLDSDDRLFSFPNLDWARMPGDIYVARRTANSDGTPGFYPCIHRNRSGVKWAGPIHEYLRIDNSPGPCDWSPLFSVIIRHCGYEDHERVLEKHERNLRISGPGLKSRNPSVEDYINLACWETVSQRFNALSWLACYKCTDCRYANLQFSNGYAAWQVISAEMLCSCGYSLPAERLLAQNPVVLRVQFAVLAAQQMMQGCLDPDRLAFLVDCLQNGYYDPYSAVPRKMLGAGPDECIAYINELLQQWRNRPRTALDFAEVQMDFFEGVFRRIDAFDADSFEDDLLVMHRETRDVVVLNPLAAVLWEALQWPLSVQDLTDLLTEAFPSEEANNLRSHVEKLVGDLLSRNLVLRV